MANRIRKKPGRPLGSKNKGKTKSARTGKRRGRKPGRQSGSVL